MPTPEREHAATAHQAPYVLAIDIGSSSVRAGLYDAQARPVPGTSFSERNWQDTGADGRNEAPPERMLKAAESAIDAAMAAARDAGLGVDAVGLDSMAATLVGIDRQGRPATPVYTYADTRPGPDVEKLKLELDVRAVHDRTGVMQHTSYAPGRIRWLKRTNPTLAATVERWTDFPTWLYSQWFARAEVPMSYSLASWYGMLNRRDLTWDPALLDELELELESLPPLAPYSQPVAGLADEYASRWPELADVPFFLGVGDGVAVNVGAGCVTPEMVALTIGTTGAMRVLVEDPEPQVPFGLWGYRLGKERTLIGGAFSEGGNVMAWAESALDIPPLDRLDDEMSKLRPDAHGLTVLPFLAGERAVGWSTHATGSLMGIRVSTTPLEIVQAFMESICYRFAMVARLLLPDGNNHRFIASGGALLSSRWWMRTMANVLRAPVCTTVDSQDTSRGTAVLALHALGAWATLSDIPTQIAETFEPDDSLAGIYVSAFERQADFYDRLFG